MAKNKRVEFLRYFNGYRMLAIFPVDIVAIAVIPFFVVFMIGSIGGLGLMFTVFGSLGLSIALIYIYKKAKEDTSKGFLKHWAFQKGLYQLKQDEKKWEELKYADKKDYFPNGQDRYFAD